MPLEVSELLVAQWLQMLAAERLGTTQTGSGAGPATRHTYTFGDQTAAHFVVAYDTDDGSWSIDSLSELDRQAVESILGEARSQAAELRTGPDVVYRVTLSTAEMDLGAAGFWLHFMRLLGDQVRIQGRRRLSDRVILEFVEDHSPADQPQLFAPKTEVTATLFVPGPVAGPLAQRVAAGLAETVSAICTLALGRVVSGGGFALFPAEAEQAQEAQALRYDTDILTLARDSTSLDIFGDLAARAGPDGMLRARGALLSYQAALEQRNPDVAVMLLVTSIEALIAPRPAWGKGKVTKRFIRATEELCPDAVDELVNHANVEQAFMVKLRGNARSRRRELLDMVYTLRSNPTHTGLSPSASEAFLHLGDPGGMRVALLSDLARGALLAYLVAPRSSLIGHPLIDPAASEVDEEAS